MIIRDYQEKLAKEAYGLLLHYKIAYLCMAVRTGKTLTAFHAAKLYGAKRVLFVTKLKAISSIKKDFVDNKPGFDLYVINYEQLHNCSGVFDLIIIDESHCIAQYPKPAQRTKLLKEICFGKPVIYLSGTPSPENYSQLFFQFWVSSYSPWKDYQTFYKWHKIYGISKVKYMYNRQINDYSATHTSMVMADIAHLMITYTQEQAGFQSQVEEKIIKIPMSDKIAWAIKTIRRDKIFYTQSGAVVLGDTKVKEMQKIHQLCSGTVKSEEGDFILFDDSKAVFIRDNFKEKKIAVFYKYIAESMQLKKIFGNRIVTDPMEFNRAGSDAVFISQFQSGREGINISTADCIVMYNIDFSALSYWQTRARLQTKDRTDPAFVYWLFIEGGLEEKIYDVVQGKKDFTISHYKKSFTLKEAIQIKCTPS